MNHVRLMIDQHTQFRISVHRFGLIAVVLGWCLCLSVIARAEAADYSYRVLGLFQQDREIDLRRALEDLPGVSLVNVNYLQGSATFRFDAEALFPGAKKPDQILSQFDQKLRQATRGTFSVTAPSGIERDQLTEIEIQVAGLDCKGCSYGAYLAVNQIEGVENAVASFHDGRVIAWIDAGKTNRETLEAALEKKGVSLVKPAAPEK